MLDLIHTLSPSQFTVFNNTFSVFDYLTKNNLDLKLKRKVIVSNCGGSRENTVDCQA